MPPNIHHQRTQVDRIECPTARVPSDSYTTYQYVRSMYEEYTMRAAIYSRGTVSTSLNS